MLVMEAVQLTLNLHQTKESKIGLLNFLNE